MARELYKLTATAVKKTTEPGRYGDGGGLYVLIQPNGNKSWVFRWRDRVTGKSRDKGLGPVWDVTLERARQAASECRAQVRAGGDPIADVRAALEAKRLERARTVTFGECARQYIEAHRPGWRNLKHADQWTSTLATYGASITALPVDKIDRAMVLKCLQPIWETKTETAVRTRQRIEAVLDWAAVREYRSGDNPARWAGGLKKLLADPAKLKNVHGRVALPYVEIGDFMRELREQDGLGARAAQLQILTASRPGEAAGALWSEIDLNAATWTIAGERMKAGRPHTVPLSDAAIDLLKSLPHRARAKHVFPGVAGNPITTAAMLKAVRTLRPTIDVHGFRSTFRDWAADRTAHPREVVEQALAHSIGAVEKAYRRTDLLAKRAKLMTDWSRFIDLSSSPGGNVVDMKRGKRV